MTETQSTRSPPGPSGFHHEYDTGRSGDPGVDTSLFKHVSSTFMDKDNDEDGLSVHFKTLTDG